MKQPTPTPLADMGELCELVATMKTKTTAADFAATKDTGFPKIENGRLYADAYDLIGTEPPLTATPGVHAVEPLKPELPDEPPVLTLNTQFSERAMRAVRSLWPEINYVKRMSTAWGNKTDVGLAASIDTLTGLPELLESNAALAEALESIAAKAAARNDETLAEAVRALGIEQIARAALASVKGRP